MDDMEAKMGAILGNPEMMSKIMAMAQSLNSETASKPEPPKEETCSSTQMPNIDMATIQKLSGLAGQSKIDRNQQTLLRALGPYLNKDRIAKLEKAMRAAKMATLASTFLGNSGFRFHSGR